MRSVADDECRRGLIPDLLRIVRQRRVPQQVVAGTELFARRALREPDPPREDDVVLVAGMRMETDAGPRPGHRSVNDSEVARDAAVDLFDRAEPAGPAPLAPFPGPHDAHGPLHVEEEPADRYV